MTKILKLDNQIRPYSWGSRTAIAGLLGRPPADEPEAELWMGAHEQAPSRVSVDGRSVPLGDWISGSAAEVLGAEVAGLTDGELPFLFKVLAAAEPLSIQAHPDRITAERGCLREDELGIDRAAAERNYRDPRPKPEILYALTPFAILRGFREPAEIHSLLDSLELTDHLPESRELADEDLRRALRRFFTAYMSRPADEATAIVDAAVTKCRKFGDGEPYRWVTELAETYPGDRGVLAPLILHIHELSPGEAMYTGPGILHAYLRGLGIELMTSSDNVLRGGLTPKHVDVPELLATLRFDPLAPTPLDAEAIPGGRRFAAASLILDVLAIGDEAIDIAHGRAAIVLCTEGSGELVDGGRKIAFAQGDSFLIPASASGVHARGRAKLFQAGATGW